MTYTKIYRTEALEMLENKVDEIPGKSLIADSEIERLSQITGGELSQEQIDDIIEQVSNEIDLSGKVDKISGSSLVPDSEITKIHEAGSDNQDLSGLVVKETGKSLVSDSEIAKIHSNDLDHAAHSDDQDLSGKVDKISGKGLSTNDYTDAEETKLAGIEAGANNYTHPANHAASVITQDASNRFVSDTEKSIWNGKTDLSTVKADTDIADSLTKKHSNSLDHTHNNKSTLDTYDQTNTNLADAISKKHTAGQDQGLDTGGSNAVTAAQAKAGYTHSQASHAPIDAQKNSDITKEEIEAKLIGEISSHTHAGGGGGLGYTIKVQALTSSPADGATVYFGMLPKAPTTTANISKVYIRKAGTIKIAEIYCYSGTAGTSEAWSLYVRKNNSNDTLIATLSVATNERVFSNTNLSIAVAIGDYVEIKGIQPTWGTNPLTTIYGGYIYIE